MNIHHTKTLATLAMVTSMAAMLIAAGGASAAAPVKLVQAGSFAGGELANPRSVAGAPNGNVYVADERNHRIQEFEADGKFVLMFGKEVNETEDKTTGASEAQKDLCTAASGNKCKAGVESTAPGQFTNAERRG